MKSSQILFLCLLATSLFCVSECVGIQGRRLMRERSVLFSNHQDEYQKIQVRKMTNAQGGSIATDFSKGEEGIEELVYHIDYHGVVTHPTPTPKHPEP